MMYVGVTSEDLQNFVNYTHNNLVTKHPKTLG